LSAINTQLGSSLLKFTFSDDDGGVLASFRINPLDMKLAQRLEEASSFFNGIQEKLAETATLQDILSLNDAIEDKICFILGYNAKESLFGQLSATSVMGDGSLFVTVVLDKLFESIGPEIDRRRQAMDKAVSKHTSKYK
jgi:hypothetical protein